MGFNHNSTNTFADNTLVSPNIYNFIGVSCLYLVSDCVEKQNTQESPTSWGVLEGILTNNTRCFSNIDFLNPDPLCRAKQLKKGFGPVFNFKIVDTNDKIIDFNGLNCYFTLYFFRRDNVRDLFIINNLKQKT
jgi:hypothetical protein